MNRLKEAAAKQVANRLKDELVEKVVGNSEVEVPNIMVEQKIDSMLQNFSQRLSMQGLSLEDYMKHTNADIETVKTEYRQPAEKGVKTDLILEAIAAKENVEATEEDIEARVAELAKHYNSEPDVFKQWLETGGNLEPLKKSIVIDKTVEFLEEKAVIK